MIEIEKKFEFCLSQRNIPAKLAAAMRYSFLAKSKQLRPKLLVATAKDLNGNIEAAYGLALAVELVHTYSLVHDDLPCMDDDDMRRGQPSNHVAFDEATAILVGDAMQPLAFELIAELELADAQKLKAIDILAKAIGPAGMVGGQIIDLSPVRDLEVLHRAKTGALIAASIALGAVSANRLDLVPMLTNYGLKIGLAFQVIDDVLDVTSDPAVLGKKVGSDEAKGKYTFVNKLGAEGAKQFADDLLFEAREMLNTSEAQFDRLDEISMMLVDRIC